MGDLTVGLKSVSESIQSRQGEQKKKKKEKRRLDFGFLPSTKSVFRWNGVGQKASCLPDANISQSCKMCGVQPVCLETRL